MPDIGSVKYMVELDDSHLDQETSKTEKSISSKLDAISGKISKSFGYQVLKDVGGAFVNMGKQAVEGFTAMSKAALESTASLEQNIGGVRKLFEDNADAVIKNAEAAYKTAGLSANDYMETVTSFSASLIAGLDGDTEAAVGYADRAIRDMADNANTFGTSMESIQTTYAGFAKGNYTMLDNLKLGFGGTKEEMQRLIETAATYTEEQERMGVTVDASSMSFDNIINAINVTQEHMGIAGATAAEAASTIEGSMASAKAAWDNFLNGTITAPEFGEALATAAGNIAKNLATILERFAETLPELVDALVEVLPEMVSELGPPILKALGAIASAGLEIGKTLLLQMVSGMKNKGPDVINNLKTLLSNLLKEAENRLPDMLQQGSELVLRIANGILEGAPQVVLNIGTVLNNLLNALLEKLPEMQQKGVEFLSKIAEGILSNAPAVMGAIGTVIGQLLTTIVAHLPELLQKGIELAGKIVEGLIKAIPQVIKGVGELIKSIKDAFKEIDWKEVGRQIIDGIKAGISSAAGRIADAARDAAHRALEAAKGFLGIQSPSKVFRQQVGEMIPAGMAEGIEDGTKEVEDSITGLSSKMIRDFTADVNYNLPALGDYSEQLGAAISANANTQINVPVIIDGREVARATAWYTNEQLAWEAR